MMSCSCGCRHLAKMVILFAYFFIVVVSTASSSAAQAAVEEDPLFGLSARRDEMVEMAGYGEERLSTVLITGSVLCEACLHGDSQLRAWPLSGASVAVSCHTNDKDGTSRIHGMTDENGDFFIDLPSELHANPNLDKICSVKLVRMPRNSLCQPVHIRKHKRVTLSSVGNGIRTYEAGTIRLLHSATKPTEACMKKSSSPRDS